MSKGNIVITGASSGIGLYTAKKFAQEGFRVFGSVRKEADAVRVREFVGDGFVPLLFDVTDHEAVRTEARRVADMIGSEGLSLLINNAGIAVSGPTTMIDLEDYRHQFEVNFFGLIATTQAFLPLLGATHDRTFAPGKIFNISSVSGKVVYPFLGPYCSSKFAVEGFSHALRREMLLYGVDVVIIGPGAIKTPIWGKAPEIEGDIAASDYGKILGGFRKAMMKEAEEGMEVDQFADKVYDIYVRGRPRVRYAILRDKFKKWTVPRYLLTDRMMDRLIRKMLRM